MSDSNLPMKFDADRKARFLACLRVTGQLQRSAQESGISPTTVRNHMKDDKEFKAAYDEAYEDFKEAIEAEIMRRAIFGWDEPVFQQGELAGTVRKFDSRLLELMAKRHIPAFKEKHVVEHTAGPGILAVPTQQTAEDWEKQNQVFPDEDEADTKELDDGRETSRGD